MEFLARQIGMSVHQFLASLPAILGLTGLAIYHLFLRRQAPNAIVKQVLDKIKLDEQFDPVKYKDFTPARAKSFLETDATIRERVGKENCRILEKALNHEFLRDCIVNVGCVLLFVTGVVLYVRTIPKAPAEEPKVQNPQPLDDPSAPLARLDDYSGNALVHQGGDKYQSGTLYRIKNRQANDPETVYPVISFNLTKIAKRDGIQVKSVKVNWKTVRRELGLISEMVLDHFTPPITYMAKLSQGKQSALASIKFQGNIVDGLIRFTENNPVAKVRLEFEGDPGLYDVTVEIEIQEDRGDRKEVLRSPKPVLILIPKTGE